MSIKGQVLIERQQIFFFLLAEIKLLECETYLWVLIERAVRACLKLHFIEGVCVEDAVVVVEMAGARKRWHSAGG